ncbi:hypothetical protein B0H65DRAFT_419411, partial [Neurospora tetraspora]
GQILDKIVIDISKKDFIIGLLYIAVSRIRTLEGIIFNESFEIYILRIRNTMIYTYKAIDICKRIP